MFLQNQFESPGEGTGGHGQVDPLALEDVVLRGEGAPLMEHQLPFTEGAVLFQEACHFQGEVHIPVPGGCFGLFYQESAKLSLGDVTAGEGGAFSMPLLYDEKQIGTYAAEEVNYTQFDLNAWREQSTVIEYTLEDGSCYYTRRELSGGEGTVTITQWTAYPADKVLTKETITLSGTVSPVLRLSQGERLAASRSAQTLSSPRLAADWSDLFEITNTIAQCLPGWAGSLASGINTISDVNILRMGVDSNMSIFELDYNNVLELLDEKCDDGTPRVSSEQRASFLKQLDELNNMVLDYPSLVFMAFAMSYFADYMVGKAIGDLVPEEISDLADSENINTIYSSLEGFQRLMMKLGKKDGVKLSGRGVDMVVGVTTGLVEFDTNVVTSMVSDATKNVLQLNLDAQEYMDRRFQEIHGDFQDLMKQIQLSYGECKDDEEEDGKEDGGNGDGGDGRNGANSLSFDMTAGLDPSGYVCEAVPSNVLEGVTVTLYKMGDGGTEEEWDAANYDQTNPVTTNADGVYAWDVPEGKWKVKFEKEGYETDCSDWLAVPPPQTNVNVSLVSEASPEIASVSAYPEGVRVEFSQYMDIESVKEELSVTTNGNAITGSVEAENAEGSLDNPEIKYASVFFFTFGESVESGTVTVSAAGAENYAENTVQETAESKTATIEVKPTGIAVQETASVGCDGTVTLQLQVQPSEAGAHKTIQVASSTSHLFNVPTSVETDENGKATLTLSGKLPGAGQLTFSLDGTSLTAATQVAVGDTTKDLPVCEAVTASPGAGVVPSGTKVVLSTETEGASIYYTLNKTCPCDESNVARKEYTGPIEITEDTYIIAYTVKEGYEDSKTSHFPYTVKEENPPVVEPDPGGSTPSRKPTVTVSGTGGTAVAQSSGVVVITPATGYKIAKVLVNGQEVAIPADGKLTGLQPSDKVTVTFEKISESIDLPFTDLAEETWYSGAVEYVYAHGLMRGMSETVFSPNTSLTRAQAVQILYNLEDQPVVSGAATFTDAEHWAKTPIAWAQQTGVVDGYEDNSFRPENPISRQEFAQMMYNYAKYKGYDLAAKGNLDAFPDADKMGAWAEPALAWANGNNLINGHDDGTLDPGGTTIRAQAASILMRFDLNIVK